MRLTWTLVGKAITLGFDVAVGIDRWLDARKARKKKGLSFKDVQHQQAQIAAATKSRAPTVILPRPPKP